jgi:DNA replicative helicase MCM subunit Mcm2 (Cdc46/Mcm family)
MHGNTCSACAKLTFNFFSFIAQLRKYISYARQYVHPRLSRGAKLVLQEFYLKLRAQNAADAAGGGGGALGGTPITTRQLGWRRALMSF